MIVYISLLIVTCLAYFTASNMERRITVKYRINGIGRGRTKESVATKKSFLIVFLLLTVFSAIRDGIGIDYVSYLMHIKNIQSGLSNYMEAGFQFLVKALSRIDSNPRFVIIVCAVVTCYFYLRAIFEQSRDIMLSLFIFLTWGYYFLTFNTIRNYLALAIALYSLKYVQNKRYIHFIILALIAGLFHKSAFVVIPLYLFSNRRFKKMHYLIFSFVPVVAILFKKYVRYFFFLFYPGYENGVYDTGEVSFLNILKALVIVALGIVYFKNIEEDNGAILFFNLNFFSLIFYTGFYWTPEISRIGFYMNATSIMFIPNLITSLKLKQNVNTLRLGVIAGSFILFLLLMSTFYSPTTKLLPYTTWLFDGEY